MTWNTLFSINSHFVITLLTVLLLSMSSAKTRLCLLKSRLYEKKGGHLTSPEAELAAQLLSQWKYGPPRSNEELVLPRVNWSSAAALRSKTAEFAERWQAGSISISLHVLQTGHSHNLSTPKVQLSLPPKVAEWAPWAVAVDLVDTDKIFLQSTCVCN